MTAHQNDSASKRVKVIGNNILISTFKKNGTLFFIVNCYIPPGSNQENKVVYSTIINSVKRFMSNYPQYPVVVGGDFNAYRKKISKELQELGLQAVFKGNATFKRSGNQLDEVFTNAHLM